MKLRRSSVAAGVAALTLSMLVNGPARAADVDITVNNGVCDYAAAGLGHGSASDPFVIDSPKSLQEMNDCSNRDNGKERQKAITAATVNGNGTVTFTVSAENGAYGVGQIVKISGTDGGTFDTDQAKVTASTATSVTVKSSVSSGSTASGTIVSKYDYYELGDSIQLGSTQDNEWNDIRSASITAASVASGTVTYTAANNFTAGQEIFINGMGDQEFNLGHVLVDTASSTQFTVTGSSLADGSASTAGGTANARGWTPLPWLSKFSLNGNGHTITGLQIHNSDSNQAVFGYVQYANISSLNMTNVLVDTTANNSESTGNYAAGLVAQAAYANFSGISVAGDLIAGHKFAGLIVGAAENTNIENSQTSGTVTSGRIYVSGSSDGEGSSGTSTWSSRSNNGSHGGVIGWLDRGSISHVSSSADVTGIYQSQDGGTNVVYSHGNGGIAGYVDESSIRYVSATGDVTGGSATGGAFGMLDYDGEVIHGSATGDVTAISNNSWDLGAVGGFAGTLMGQSGNSYISSSGSVTASVTADGSANIFRVGGLAGYQFCCGSSSHLTTESSVTVTQRSSDPVYEIGGLFGADDCCDGTVDAHATGNVTIVSEQGGNVYDVGGLLGAYWCCGTYRDVSATGDISITTSVVDGGYAYDVGGLVGYFDCCGAITGATSTGDVTVNNGYQIGGLMGRVATDFALRDASATGNVTVSYDGNASVGGLVGKISGGRHNWDRVSSSGNVIVSSVTAGQDANYVGGLVGYLEAQGILNLRDAYHVGDVTATDYVGGLFGNIQDDFQIQAKRVYVASEVEASASTPLYVDPVANGLWVDNNSISFMDSTLAGTSVNGPELNAATSASMTDTSVYQAKGWSFEGDNSPWRIASDKNSGYPYLVIPVNDDTTVTNPVEAPSAEPTPSPTDGGASATVYKALKSIKFKGNGTTLTKANKKALRAVAKKIAASDYKVIVLRGRPAKTKVEIAAKRQRSIYVYLTKQLSKLDSTKTIRMEYKIKSKNKATNIIKILGGK